VIANGYDETDLASCQPKQTDSQFITLSFIGMLGDHSLPKEFLKTLARLLESNPELANILCVNFIGNKSAQAECLLNDFKFQKNIKVIGHVSKIEALNLMAESDALLVLAGKGMESYIPGKLFDYLSLKKPILYFGAKGEASTIVEQLGAGFSIVDGDKEGMCEFFNMLTQQKFIIEESTIDNWLKDYTRSFLAHKLYEELSVLVEN